MLSMSNICLTDTKIAVIDMVKDFKTEREWTLGLMMIDPSERGKGLGKRLHEYIKEMAAACHAEKLCLGFVLDNTKAQKFWSSLGYTEVDRVCTRYGEKDNVVVVMNYYI